MIRVPKSSWTMVVFSWEDPSSWRVVKDTRKKAKNVKISTKPQATSQPIEVTLSSVLARLTLWSCTSMTLLLINSISTITCSQMKWWKLPIWNTDRTSKELKLQGKWSRASMMPWKPRSKKDLVTCWVVRVLLVLEEIIKELASRVSLEKIRWLKTKSNSQLPLLSSDLTEMI